MQMETVKIKATPAARRLARRLNVNLADVKGTGLKGRIHKEDVAGFNYVEKILISPLAQQIAEYYNIDWKNGVKGSGYRGKILKEDIVKLIQDKNIVKELSIDLFQESLKPSAQTAAAPQPTASAAPVAQSASASAPVAQPSAAPVGDTEEVPMNMMRKVIAKRMSESYFSAPTFIVTYEVDMTECLALRKKLIEPIMERIGKKLTVTDLINMALVKTLMKHRDINASLSPDGSKIIQYNYVNLAVAVGMPEGLLVPVVKGADKMSLAELVAATKDLVSRTLSKKLQPDEQQGSTFTISNLGMYGVESFTSIINQPNSAILSVAATKEMPVVRDGQIVIRPIMKMGLTSDHRVINGLAAAQFMQDLKAAIENPMSLLI